MEQLRTLLQSAIGESISASEAIKAELDAAELKGVSWDQLKWRYINRIVKSAEGSLSQALDIINDMAPHMPARCADCGDGGTIGYSPRTGYCSCPAGRELLQLTCEFNEELRKDAEAADRELPERKKRDGEEDSESSPDHEE